MKNYVLIRTENLFDTLKQTNGECVYLLIEPKENMNAEIHYLDKNANLLGIGYSVWVHNEVDGEPNYNAI